MFATFRRFILRSCRRSLVVFAFDLALASLDESLSTSIAVT